MKRLSTSHELSLYRPLLVVGDQRTALNRKLLTQGLEPGFDQIRGRLRIDIMDREFKQFPGEKAPLNRPGLGFRQGPFLGLDLQYPHCRLITGEKNCNIQRMSGCPSYQLFRRIPPAQTEGGLQNTLAESSSARPQHRDKPRKGQQKPWHGDSLENARPLRKARSLRRAFVMVEAIMALTILTTVGLVLLKLSLNILHPRQWVLQQTVTDAYMTYERSYAERIPFDDLLASTSPWPAFPATATTSVELGKYPGGRSIAGTVVRTRVPDDANYPIDGGTGTVEINPAAMKVWKAQSLVTYQVGNRTYAKSRTVLRSQ